MRLKKELMVIECFFKILCVISFVDVLMRKMVKCRRECLEYILKIVWIKMKVEGLL